MVSPQQPPFLQVKETVRIILGQIFNINCRLSHTFIVDIHTKRVNRRHMACARIENTA